MLVMKVETRPYNGITVATVGALSAAILLLGFLAQELTYLNHDVAWVLYSSKLLLDGAIIGRDVVAANPPLIWWLSSIPNAAAQLLGMPVVESFRLFVLLILAASLFFSDRFLVAGRAPMAMRALFLLSGAYLLTLAVHRDFGQREHLALALLLPYILSIAHRLDRQPIRPVWAFALGAAAGVGVAFKPHLVLVPLFLESVLLWRLRSLRVLVRPEALGAIAAIALYGAGLLLFARSWLFDAIPDIARVYWAFDESLAGRATFIILKFTLPVIGSLVVLAKNGPRQSAALLLAGCGFLAAALLQGKYYSYHFYPAFVLFVLAFMTGLPGLPKLWRFPATLIVIIIFATSIHESFRSLWSRSDWGPSGSRVASVMEFVVRNVPPDGSFLVVSTYPHPGFPTALYTQRRWASASNSALFMPAVVRLRESGIPSTSALRDFAERKAREAILRDLKSKPDLILIDSRRDRHAIGITSFDFLRFYLEDQRFRDAWVPYRRVPSAPRGFVAYARQKVGP